MSLPFAFQALQQYMFLFLFFIYHVHPVNKILWHVSNIFFKYHPLKQRTKPRSTCLICSHMDVIFLLILEDWLNILEANMSYSF